MKRQNLPKRNDPKRVVTRIDFFRMPDGRVRILKLTSRGRRETPVEIDLKPPEFDLKEALEWCEGNGYSVREWPGGARAWYGEPWPIRTRHEIKKKRQELERRVQAGEFNKYGDVSVLDHDLRYDL